MRRCPNKDCKNAGFIELKPCIQRAQGPEGELKWREIAQMTLYHKLTKHIGEGVKLRSDHLSYFNEVLYGNACPNGDSIIFKNGGCPHMKCQKGNYDFCWLCLGHYPNYIHDPGSYCGLRLMSRFAICMFLLIVVDLRLSFLFPLLGYLQAFILTLVFKIVVSDLVVLVAVGFEVILWAIAILPKYGGGAGGILCRLFFVLFALATLGFYLYLIVWMWYSEMFSFIVTTVFYEILFVVFIALAAGGGAIFCGRR